MNSAILLTKKSVILKQISFIGNCSKGREHNLKTPDVGKFLVTSKFHNCNWKGIIAVSLRSRFLFHTTAIFLNACFSGKSFTKNFWGRKMKKIWGPIWEYVSMRNSWKSSTHELKIDIKIYATHINCWTLYSLAWKKVFNTD